jgi:hypothetical protein
MVANTNRCACITRKGRRCKKAFSFVCNKAKCCFIHANAYLKFVLTIQNAYKGYHCRKYVRLLARLPCDIQDKILFYMRYDAKKNKCIQKILCKKVDTLLGIPQTLRLGFVLAFFENPYTHTLIQMDKTEFANNILQISHLYKLYTKYMSIINREYANALYFINHYVINIIAECVYRYHFIGGSYLYTEEELTALNNSVQELEKVADVFKLEYKYHYCQ